MTRAVIDALEHLLTTSVEYWFPGRKVVITRRDGELLVFETNSCRLTISRAPPGMPFNWVVQDRMRKRTAASVVGVLQVVRLSFSDDNSADYAPATLRIVPMANDKK